MHPYNRPKALKSLLILSFTGSGAGFLLYLAAVIFHNATKTFILQYSSSSSADVYSQLYFGLFALLYAASLYGVWQMWSLRRKGLYLYSLSQTAILLLPLIWIGKPAFSSVALIITVVFISAYAFQFRQSFNA